MSQRCGQNMAYTVDVAKTAEEELDAALAYIATNYSSVQAMASLLDAFDNAQESLRSFPAVFSRHEGASAATGREIRWIRAKGYGLFFCIDEEHRRVQVISFLHLRQDIAWRIARDLELQD